MSKDIPRKQKSHVTFILMQNSQLGNNFEAILTKRVSTTISTGYGGTFLLVRCPTFTAQRGRRVKPCPAVQCRFSGPSMETLFTLFMNAFETRQTIRLITRQTKSCRHLCRTKCTFSNFFKTSFTIMGIICFIRFIVFFLWFMDI